MSIPVEEQLERLIDQHGIGEILLHLADIAVQKSAHIRDNWQDKRLARLWYNISSQLEKVGDKANREEM